MDLKSPSDAEITKVLDSYQNQVRNQTSHHTLAEYHESWSICRFKIFFCFLFWQSSIDSDKPFVLDKHLHNIDRWAFLFFFLNSVFLSFSPKSGLLTALIAARGSGDVCISQCTEYSVAYQDKQAFFFPFCFWFRAHFPFSQQAVQRQQHGRNHAEPEGRWFRIC